MANDSRTRHSAESRGSNDGPGSSRTRRSFLKSSIGGISLGAVPGLTWGGIADRYADLQSSRYVGEVRIETRVEEEQVFTEGPAVDRRLNVYFTNIPASKILKWDPGSQRLTVFRENSNRANGLLIDPKGRLLACEADRITRTDMRTGKIEVLANSYEDQPLEAANDLALDQKGRIYFTSRPSSLTPARGSAIAVYRIDPDGKIARILKEPETQMPNGIVVSSDDRILNLVEAHPDEGHFRHIRAYDLNADGRVSNGRILIDFYPGRSGDGMCIDAEGNLYVAAGLHSRRGTSETLDTRPGIHVISPGGRLLAYAKTPEDTVTNCTFGGEDLRTLYVTCGRFLLSVRTRIPGKAGYRTKR